MKRAEKLYEGSCVWLAREKPCETWNAGLAEKTLDKSALAPSNMVLVSWVAAGYVNNEISSIIGEE
jgi:hypothetical protein